MGCQGEGEGGVGRDMSGQAEQGLGKRFGKKDEREFGRKMGGWQVEGEVTGKTGRW